MTERQVKRAAWAAAGARFAFGIVPLIVPGAAARVMGLPVEQDSPTARLMARLFAVRELALATMVWRSPNDPLAFRRTLALNAAVDAGDAAVFAGALAARAGIDRAAASMVVPALAGCAIWLDLRRRVEARPNLRARMMGLVDPS